MYFNKKIYFIIIFVSIINNVSASIKENIIDKFNNIENISFNFEQNINGIIENGNCTIEYPKKIYCKYNNFKKKSKIDIMGRNIKNLNSSGLIFNIDELPEMTRGKGVRLQKFKDGGLADLTTFKDIVGLSFIDSAGRTNAVSDWTVLQGKRAGAGRLAPRGFSRQGLFSPDKRLF